MDTLVQSFIPKGKISVPCSKSYAHRALIMAFLSKQKTTVKNITFSDDINYTLNALISMGANVIIGDDFVSFEDYNECPDKLVINVGMSASPCKEFLFNPSTIIPPDKTPNTAQNANCE